MRVDETNLKPTPSNLIRGSRNAELRAASKAADHDGFVQELLEEAKSSFQCVADVRQHEIEEMTTQQVSNKEFSDVLIIVTGGTLTMVASDQGYAPARGLGQRLKNHATFNDKAFCKEIGLADDSEVSITPESPFGQRIRFRVHEFDNLIDSSCVTLE